MAIINGIIPEQNFEIVRDQLFDILVDELATQFSLRPTEVVFNATGYKEKFIAFDKTQLPAFNVYFTDSNRDDNNPKNSSGEVRINIDCEVSAKHTDLVKGDTAAALELQKLMGAIRFILRYPGYVRLGFPISPPFIFSHKVESLQIVQPSEKDATHTISGRVTWSGKVLEDNGDLIGTPDAIARTTAKLDETEKGYITEVL